MIDEHRNRKVAAVIAIILLAVVAIIILYPHQVTVTHEGEGAVEPTEGGIRFYETLAVEVTPDEGWEVSEIRADGARVDFSDGTLTVTVPLLRFSASSVHVVFQPVKEPVEVTHTVTVTSTSGGTVEPSGTVEVLNGGSLTLSFSPNSGYRLSALYVDGVRVASGIGSYTLSDIVSDRTVHAVFTRIGGGGGTVTPYLIGIEVTTEPNRTVYAVGDTFDPEGMVVVARYSDGSWRTLSEGDYSLSPTRPLVVGDTEVTVSYRGFTDTVGISVVDPGDFSVTVTRLSGTCVSGGVLTAFSDDTDTRLSDFSFRTSNIVPGVEQTARMTVTNGTATDLEAVLFIQDLDLSGRELAEQVVITAMSGGTSVSASVAEIGQGVLLNLGTVPAGGSVDVMVTLSFPQSEDNNEAMGQTISFTMGVFADDLTGVSG